VPHSSGYNCAAASANKWCISSTVASQPGQFVPIYNDGAGLFKKCKKTTQVFSVTICYTQKAWDKGDKKKIDHIAHVLAQHIDNDADGEIDHPDLISYIVNNDMFMFVKYDERYVIV